MNEIQLTELQEKKLSDYFKRVPDPSILEMTRIAFPNLDKVDGRTKEGKAVRDYLVKNNIKYKTNAEYVPDRRIILSEEQKDFINKKAAQGKSAIQIAEMLFNKGKLTALHLEARVVKKQIDKFAKESNILINQPNVEYECEGAYSPPQSESGCIQRANRYIKEKIDKTKMSPKQKRDIQTLISFLHNPRFLDQITKYTDQTKRNLFEGSFIRYVHDKPDLTEEEIDQYIMLATEVVNGSSVADQIESLRKHRDEQMEEEGKISMTIVEAISKSQTEYNQCSSRQQQLLTKLTKSRKERVEEKLTANSSLLNFVDLMKKEETRKKMAEIGKRNTDKIRLEIDRLTSMDDLKLRILGATENESLYGN